MYEEVYEGWEYGVWRGGLRVKTGGGNRRGSCSRIGARFGYIMKFIEVYSAWVDSGVSGVSLLWLLSAIGEAAEALGVSCDLAVFNKLPVGGGRYPLQH